jgi:hypothetical protein
MLMPQMEIFAGRTGEVSESAKLRSSATESLVKSSALNVPGLESGHTVQASRLWSMH